MQGKIKKWFKDREYGFIENGSSPDIIVRKESLVKKHPIKPGSLVSFEVTIENNKLLAKKVSLVHHNNQTKKKHTHSNNNPGFIGVMS